eukprot:gene5553-6238_t
MTHVTNHLFLIFLLAVATTFVNAERSRGKPYMIRPTSNKIFFARIGQDLMIQCLAWPYRGGCLQLFPVKMANSMKNQARPAKFRKIHKEGKGNSVLRIASYMFYNISRAELGTYTCMAVNSLGYSAKTFSIKEQQGLELDFFNYDLKFHSAVQTFFVGFLGSKISLDCSVTSLEPVSVEWYMNKRRLSKEDVLSEKRMKLHENDQILTIRDLNYGDWANYKCICVGDKSKILIKREFRLFVVRGKRVRPKPTTPSSYNNTKYTPQTRHNFTIARANNTKHARVPLRYSTSTSKMKFVMNYLLPTFLLAAATTYVTADMLKFASPVSSDLLEIVGNKVSLDCFVTSFEPVSVEWYKDKQRLNKDEIINGRRLELDSNDQMLTFIQLQHGDKGTYKCVVSNSKHSINRTFTIVPIQGIRSKPLVVSPRDNQVFLAKIGQDLTIECVALGNGGIHFQLIFVAKKSMKDKATSVVKFANAKAKYRQAVDKKDPYASLQKNIASYTFHKISRSEMRTYTCMAGNAVGYSTTTFSIKERKTVVPKPACKDDPRHAKNRLRYKKFCKKFCKKSSKWFKWMRDHCAKTCKLCRPGKNPAELALLSSQMKFMMNYLLLSFLFAAATYVTADTECKDVESQKDCKSWKKLNYCNVIYTEYMKKNCKATCGLCPTLTDCQNTPQHNANCENNWKSYCNKRSQYRPFMEKNCKKTCGLCKKVEAATPKPTTPKPTVAIKSACKDTPKQAKNCPSYKKFCKKASRWFKWMHDHCPKTCKFCRDDCGLRGPVQGRVIGGVEAEAHSWPWSVALLRFGGYFCGGTLIDEQWVLSAAHCIYGREDQPQFIQAVLGEHDRSVNGKTEQKFDVAKIIPHANYDSRTLDNDIAMIKLKEKVVLKKDKFGNPDKVGLACLPKQGETADIKDLCFITGWGKTKGDGTSSQVLMEAQMPTVTNEKCKKLNAQWAINSNDGAKNNRLGRSRHDNFQS